MTPRDTAREQPVAHHSSTIAKRSSLAPLEPLSLPCRLPPAHDQAARKDTHVALCVHSRREAAWIKHVSMATCAPMHTLILLGGEAPLDLA